ncbi:MAG TPA: hypothetical protein VIN10_08305 [Bacteroidales bacterium]
MKNYILIAAALFMASFSFSQSTEEINLIQSIFGVEKQEVVADFVQPSDTEKDAFWKLYDEYETERKELGKQRIALLEEYAAEYMTMTSEQADAWTKKAIELQKNTDALIVTYYGKIKKATDGILATQFYQIENYILTYIRMHILQEVPFVEKS